MWVFFHHFIFLAFRRNKYNMYKGCFSPYFWLKIYCSSKGNTIGLKKILYWNIIYYVYIYILSKKNVYFINSILI